MERNLFLKEILAEKGIKQRFIAGKLGVSVSTVSLWAQEKRLPTLQNLKKLAQGLDVDFDLLIKGKKEWYES